MLGQAGILRIIILPLLVSSVIIGWQVLRNGTAAPINDEIAYLSISRALHEIGVFTDGTLSTMDNEDRPGRFFAPVYPAFVALVLKFDGKLASAVECYGRRGTECAGSLASLVIAQSALAAVTGLLIFLISWRISENQGVGWMAMIAALASGEFGDYARRYLTETISFTLLFAFLYLTVRSYLDQSKSAACLAGVAISVASLTRPTYLYLYVFMIFIIPNVFYFGRHKCMRGALSFAALFVAGGATVIIPWCARNYYYFGDLALTKGYAELALVQRLGYNAMTWREVGVAAIAWLPGIGEPLVKVMFAPELYERLGTSTYSDFEPLYVYRGDLFERTLTAAGAPEQHLKYLIWKHVLEDLPKHLVVTLLMTIRGLWVGKYLSFAGMACLIPAVWLVRGPGRVAFLALFLLPLVFLSLLYGFASTSIFRYHVPMIGAYALAVALVCAALFASLRNRLRLVAEPPRVP